MAFDAGHEDGDEEEAAEAAGEQAEDGVEVVEEGLYVPGGHEEGDDEAYEAAGDACPSCYAEELVVGDGGSEALDEVYADGGGDAVDVAGDGAHGGGEDGGNKQAGDAGWHLAHHEEGEDGVGLGHGDVEALGVGLVEGIEACAYDVECDGDEDAHEAVDEDAAACGAFVGGGHVALDDGLVGGV